jgi:hypothetical protein
MADVRYAYRVLVGKPEGIDRLENLSVDGRVWTSALKA